MKKHLAITLLMILIGTGCTKQDDWHALKLDKEAETVNFANIVAGDWNRLCFFGPYSSNTTASTTLGFDWDLENNSRIAANDGISLAVFTDTSKVIAYYEISRYTDFSHFSRQCFNKTDSTFKIQTGNITHESMSGIATGDHG